MVISRSRVVALAARNAWSQQRQLGEVPPVQREIRKLPVLDDHAGVGGRRVDLRGCVGHLDFGGDGADRELEVQCLDLRHLKLNVLNLPAEAGRGNLGLVVPRGKAGYVEVSG